MCRNNLAVNAEKKNDCRFKGGYFKMGDPRDACFLLLNNIEDRKRPMMLEGKATIKEEKYLKKSHLDKALEKMLKPLYKSEEEKDEIEFQLAYRCVGGKMRKFLSDRFYFVNEVYGGSSAEHEKRKEGMAGLKRKNRKNS